MKDMKRDSENDALNYEIEKGHCGSPLWLVKRPLPPWANVNLSEDNKKKEYHHKIWLNWGRTYITDCVTDKNWVICTTSCLKWFISDQTACVLSWSWKGKAHSHRSKSMVTHASTSNLNVTGCARQLKFCYNFIEVFSTPGARELFIVEI